MILHDLEGLRGDNKHKHTLAQPVGETFFQSLKQKLPDSIERPRQ